MARNKRGLEPVYSALAPNYEQQYVAKNVTLREAKRLESERLTVRYCRLCGRDSDSEGVRCKRSNDGQHAMVSKLVEPRRELRSTPTITLGEMNINAGSKFADGGSRTMGMSYEQRRKAMAEGKIETEEDFIETALTKVANWPFIAESEHHGCKAVRVCPVRIEAQ